MNIPASLRLDTLLQTTPAQMHDVALVKYANRLYLGCVVEPSPTDRPPKGKLEVQWYKPLRACKGYQHETVFIPTFNKNNLTICDFIHTSRILPINNYVTKQDLYGHEFEFSAPLPQIIMQLCGQPDEESTEEEPGEALSSSESEFESEWTEEEEQEQPPPPPPLPKRTPYNTTKKAGDVYKQQINDILAHMARDARMLCHTLNPANPSAALFLDAEDARTTTTLHKIAGYRLENMFAPNYSQKVIDLIHKNTRSLPGKLNTPCVMMEAFTDRVCAPQKYSFVWIDGCATWEGSSSTQFCTKRAVLNVFRNKLLDAHSVVAYTVNMRGKKGKQTETARRELDATYAQVKEVANQNGYTVEIQPKLHHVASSFGDVPNCGQMLTAYMRVWK